MDGWVSGWGQWDVTHTCADVAVGSSGACCWTSHQPHARTQDTAAAGVFMEGWVGGWGGVWWVGMDVPAGAVDSAGASCRRSDLQDARTQDRLLQLCW
jgi:hypothetical protein